MADTSSYRDQLQQAYAAPSVSDNYIKERFDTAMGAMLHEAQVGFVTRNILSHGVSNVLELAPGPARLTVDIGRRCQSVRGVIVDVNENMLQKASRRLAAAGLEERWQVLTGDAFSLALQETFDLIYSFRFIRHFQLQDREKIYQRIHRHLAPQGFMVLDAINRQVSAVVRAKEGAEHYPIYDELYNLPQLEAELRQNGFRIVDHHPVQKSYWLLRLIQIYLAPRSQEVARLLMNLVECGWGQPLEWIVLCQKN